MESTQGSDLPCKKLRTMFPAMEGDADAEEGKSLSCDPGSATDIELMGPEGDMKRDQIRGQCNMSDVEIRPGCSGDQQTCPPAIEPDTGSTISMEATCSYPTAEILSVFDVETHSINQSIYDVEDQSACGATGSHSSPCSSGDGGMTGSRNPARRSSSSEIHFYMQDSVAIAANAYIKNKENEKLSGESCGSYTRSSHTGTKVRDLFPVASTSHSSQNNEQSGDPSKREHADSEKIISFDRADFDFDFYGAPARNEEDGTVISPPERMADTGFIEMFSNSVMSSVLLPGAQGTQSSSSTGWDSRRPAHTTGYIDTSQPTVSRPFKPVKQINVPFILDSSYVNSVISQHNINSLPQSLLVQIFKSLSPFTLLRRTSRVCKYWYNVSRDPDLWREINLRNQYRLCDAPLIQLLGFSDRVLKVNLTDCRFVSDAGIRRLVLKCQHLHTLKLMRCFDLTDSSFAGMGSWHLGSNLHTLHLDGCCRISDNTVVEIAEACHHISSLHLNQCTKVSDVGILALARHCHGIKQLLLDHCSKVTDKGLTELVLGCPNIAYLNIMSCGVTDTGIKMLSKLENLTNLDVSNIPLMTPAGIEYVSRYCKKMDCINVSLNSVIDDKCVTEVVKNLPNLLRLYCVSCSVTDKGMESIAKYRPTLEALDVGWCQDVTDQGARVISLACRKLDYFGLIRCDKISIETIEELMLKFPTVNYSTFILESRRLLERARKEGYQFGL